MKIFVAMFTLIPSVFVVIGSSMAYVQQHRIASFVPVTARAVDGKVEVVESSDSDGGTSYSYKPVITYTYEVSGRSYKSSRVTPIEVSAGSRWAHTIVNRYPPGKECEAYYDPADPAKAFLIPEVSFTPYIFIIFPMPFFAAAAGVGFGSGMRGRRTPAPIPRADKWLEIRPVNSIGRRIRMWSYVGLAWWGVGVLVFGHYFYYASAPYGTDAIVFACIYGGLAIVAAIPAIYYRLLKRNVADAKVLVDRPLITCGRQFGVRVTQTMLAGLTVEEFKLGLICEASIKRKTSDGTAYSNFICHQGWATLLKDHGARRGEVLSATYRATLPADANPSSPSKFEGYPFYRWRVRIVTRIAGSPDYRGDFAIFVTGAQAAAGAGATAEAASKN